MSEELPERLPRPDKPNYEEGPASEATKAQMKQDALDLLAMIDPQIAELEAREDSLDEDDREALEMFRQQAAGFREIIADCENPDFHPRIRTTPKNDKGDSVYFDPGNN